MRGRDKRPRATVGGECINKWTPEKFFSGKTNTQWSVEESAARRRFCARYDGWMEREKRRRRRRRTKRVLFRAVLFLFIFFHFD